MRFSQTIALVTGAGSGIGKATAIRLAAEGAKVILVGRTESKLMTVANEINSTKKIPMAEIFAADVTDKEDIQELADYINQQFGDLHILINNAGGAKYNSKILETSDRVWDQIHNSNLKSVFLVSQILGRVMVQAAKNDSVPISRSVVNVAALSGHHAGVFYPHFDAAKAGVINLTKGLALELAPYGIRVNSVSPGNLNTSNTEAGSHNEESDQKIALGRMGSADEVANVITFLASEEASFMTGSDVIVDGGGIIQ